MDARARFVGIDVSKAHLDVAARPGGEPARPTDDAAGIAGLVNRLRPLTPTPVAVESTGGPEVPLAAALAVAGLPVAVINPRRARDLAEAAGRPARTDRIDAEILARFAGAIRPAPRPMDDPATRAPDSLLGRRDRPLGMRTTEASRPAACPDPAVKADVRRHLDRLEAEVAEADRRLAAAIREGPIRRQKDELLRSIPGLGPITGATLLAAVPESGAIDGGKLSAPAGLAPFNDDSGRRGGARPIRGGRADVGRLLYPAALSAVRFNPAMRASRGRLEARGKPAEVILTAVARELLVIADAIIRSGCRWRPELAAAG